MGGSSSPPPAPDPGVVAAKQAEANKATALQQFGLNATNQVTPTGSISYQQIGTWADGTPRFQATSALSAPEQGVYNTDVANRQSLGQIGGAQIGRVADTLSSPVQLTNEAAEGRLAELGRARLDPAFAQKQAALETSLANKGITMGSAAYNNAMGLLNQQQTDAYNQLFLTGRNQAMNELLTQRNQPLNELNALRSMSQVAGINPIQTPQTNVSPTNVGDIYNNAYQNQLKAYGIQQGSENAMMGGLFGLAGTLGGAAIGGPVGASIGGAAGKGLFNLASNNFMGPGSFTPGFG